MVRRMAWMGWMVSAVLVACDGPDEWTCEVEANGAAVCVDLNSRQTCEDWGGTATPAELEPGGPYEYCEDVGYDIACTGSLVEKGDGFTANHPFRAGSEDDCAAADGAQLGG